MRKPLKTNYFSLLKVQCRIHILFTVFFFFLKDNFLVLKENVQFFSIYPNKIYFLLIAWKVSGKFYEEWKLIFKKSEILIISAIYLFCIETIQTVLSSLDISISEVENKSTQ